MIRRLQVCYSNENEPYRNFAYEALLAERVEPETAVLFLWQNRPSVIFGRNQNAFKECAVDRLKGMGILPARRLSGGGTVYHDLGNLCFSFLTTEEEHDRVRECAVLQSALARFGILAELSGRNDLTVGGKKISGTAIYRLPSGKDGRNRVCHHGTLLVSVDLDALSAVLTVSREKLCGKGIASVRSRVLNLASLSEAISAEGLQDALAAAFSAVYGLPGERLPLPEREDPDLQKKDAFFRDPDFIFGESAPFTDEIDLRLSDCLLSLRFSVEEGRVTDCRLETDAMDPTRFSSLPALLSGCRYERALLANRLREDGRNCFLPIADALLEDGE